MKYFEKFLNTPYKRYAFFSLIFVLILIDLAIANFQLGYFLRMPASISEFQAILELLPLQETFFGRLVLLEFQLKVNFWEVISTVSLREYLFLFTFLMIFITEKDLFYQKVKKIAFLVILVIILKYSLIIGLILKSLKSVDVFLITNNLNLIGWILMVSSVVTVILGLYLAFIIFENLKVTTK